MCKEMPVIPVSRVVDPKRIIGKKWRAAKEEERHKGSLTHKKCLILNGLGPTMYVQNFHKHPGHRTLRICQRTCRRGS
jgi:hypothetical protein